MPRHTHPPAKRKHSRAHTRYQRDRYIRRRWQQAKDRYSFSWRHPAHPETVERQQTSGGRWALVDPADWPFYLPDNRFARNLWTVCSCMLCRWEKHLDPRRAREARQWRAEAEQEASGGV